jgi:hypothetical protein
MNTWTVSSVSEPESESAATILAESVPLPDDDLDDLLDEDFPDEDLPDDELLNALPDKVFDPELVPEFFSLSWRLKQSAMSWPFFLQ